MKKKITFLLLCAAAFLHLSTSVHAQAKPDSLFSLLKTDKEDTNKVNHLNLISGQLRNTNPDTSTYYAKAALTLAQKLNYKKGMATAYLWLGSEYEILGKLDAALSTLSKAIDVAKQINDQKTIAGSYNVIGLVDYQQDNYVEALKNHFEALKIRQMIGDKKEIPDSYFNIGIGYYYLDNYPDALKNYFIALQKYDSLGSKKGLANVSSTIGLVYEKESDYSNALKNQQLSLQYAKETGNQQLIANAYNNLGNVYLDLGHYPDALKSYAECVKIFKTVGYSYGLAGTYYNIGGVYLFQKEYEDAVKSFADASKIWGELGNKAGVANCYISSASAFLNQKRYQDAQKYLAKAKELADSIRVKDCLQDLYKTMSDLDSATGNFRGAYENHKLYVMYRDSINNEETKKKTIRSQMNYDFEKKEAIEKAEHKKELEDQAALADEKSRKQNSIIISAICGLALVIIFSIFLFNRFRVTQKQKMVIESQKIMVEEKQKEILDSIHYAKRIQRSILPTEKFIHKSLDRLKKD